MTLRAKSPRVAPWSAGIQHPSSAFLGMLALAIWFLAAQGVCWEFAGEKGPSARGGEKPKVEQAKNAAKAREKARAAKAKAKARRDALAALLEHLGVGEGATVADVGAGRGQYTWDFAQIVGETGTVFAEEITDDMVKSLEKQAEEKGLAQVRPVLGSDDDPALPPDSVDLVFIRYVYHHFAKPRPMLRGIWRSLKPGGRLVVVDRRRGTLEDWGPRLERGKKHFWIAETTVVREAREEGFALIECAEDLWYEKEPFVLIFQRPQGADGPGADPDPFRPLSIQACSRLLPPVGRPYQRPVFIATGEARKLIEPILGRSSGEGLEIVLEEWATQKDEREPLPAGVSLPSVLTEKGDPSLGPEPIDVVFFLDSYHLLFHGKTLLAKLHERLAPNGCVYVLDREAKEPLPRREASHRRRIDVDSVKREMAEAGFSLQSQGPPPAPDRFLLVFEKARPE